MLGYIPRCVLQLLLMCQLCSGLVFTRTPNATSETCDGGDFTFNWVYASGTPNSIVWTKRNNDGTLSATLAAFTLGEFFPDPAYATRVTQVGNKGVIKLSGTTAADNGVYQIELVDFSTVLKGNTTLSSFAVNGPINASCVETAAHVYTVTCSVDVTPPVTLQLKNGTVDLDSASSASGLSKTLSDAHNQTFQCSVTGQGSECVTPNSADVTCISDLAEVVLETQGSATCRPHRVYVGQRNVQLTCRVTAANLAVTSYTWTHNSSVIQSARGAVLTISSVSWTSGEPYTCQGNNSLGGSTSSPVTLEVQYGPSVSVVASTQTVTEGQILAVTCSVDSKPAATVTWTKKDGRSFTPQTGSTLTISNIQRSQGGTYVCTATNTLSPCGGTALPRSDFVEVTVDVQYPATVSMFTANTRSGSVTVNKSDPVTFRCQVDSNPRSVIRLLNGIEELTRADNSLTSEYRLESADCRQRGNYSCTATNNIGTPVSQRVELKVKCSPRLDETVPHQLKYVAILGGNVNMSVSVLAYPLPTFTWSRTTSTSQDLTGSSSPVSDISVTARLHLTNLQQQDFGDYQLTVDNGLGRGLFYTVRIVSEDAAKSPGSGTAWTGIIAWTATGTQKLAFTHRRNSYDAITQKQLDICIYQAAVKYQGEPMLKMY